MVRAIKAKSARSPSKGEKAVLMPGLTDAEPWELWMLGGGAAECVATCAEPSENRQRRTSTLALPVAEVFCVPLWLNETEPKQFAGMIPLQLEMRGLQPRNQAAAVFDWAVAAKEEARTLVVVGVLPASLPEEIQAENYPAFDLSARFLPLAENAITIWQERDRLVFTITRDTEPVYFQALTDSRVSARIIQDISVARDTLSMQGVVASLRDVVLWVDAPPADVAALKEGLGLPVRVEDRPAPRVPAKPWNLVPATVSRAKETRKNRRWIALGLIVAFLLYLVFVGWMTTRFLLARAEVAALTQWQKENAPALAAVQDTRSAWKNLGPVVDEKNYPLELLSHIQTAIPADQLHLTLFETSDGHLLIKGEAKNVSGAFQFLDALKKDKGLAGYTFDMGQPRLLPNDLAQFQIDGASGAETP